MSRYFNWPTSLKRLVRFSAARAEDVNDALDDLSAGMDTLDADVDRAIKLPVGAGNQVLNLAPGVRANKVLAFDASGNVSVSVNDVDSSAASASAAQSSANAAAVSAATAGTQGGIATTKAGEAAASASAAASSATAASASQSAALTSQNSAATSASTATAQASAASASASAAAASQSAAAGSATAASTSASNAAASQSAAAASATNAANSATAASTSATNAAVSASSASTSATNASKLNLGAKASEPTLDNQGQPLQAGASYYDTTMVKWRVWSGAGWINGYPGAVVQSVNGQTGNAALGKFDLTPIAAATFSYTNNLVTGMSEDGVTTTIAYNAQNQVSTVTYQRGANTLVETYTYSNGKVVSMSSTGSLGTVAGGSGGGGGGGSGGPAVWGNITGTLADQPDLALALAAKANTATLAAVATAGTYASLTGKPTLGTAAASNVGDFAAASHSHAASAISDSTATGRALLTTANAAAARSTLGLGSAATSAAGDFATAAQGVKADSAVQPAGLAPYAKTADLPPVPTHVSQLTNDAGYVSDISGKQDVLVSGSNIKTVNGQTLLGGGDLVIAGGGGGGSSAWAGITGKPQLLSSEGWQAALLPGRGGTLSAIGMLADVLETGTITHAALNTASLRQSLRRFTLTSAATVDAHFEHAGAYLLMTRGDMAGIGGFSYLSVFSVADTTNARRGFIGMRGSTTSWSGAVFPPNGVTLCVGVGFDAALHSTYQIAHSAHANNSGSYVDTGIPLNNPESVLELLLSCPPNGDSIAWSLKDINSGLSASGALTTNILNKFTFYSHRVRMDNNGAAVAVSCDVMGIWMSNYLG